MPWCLATTSSVLLLEGCLPRQRTSTPAQGPTRAGSLVGYRRGRHVPLAAGDASREHSDIVALGLIEQHNNICATGRGARGKAPYTKVCTRDSWGAFDRGQDTWYKFAVLCSKRDVPPFHHSSLGHSGVNTRMVAQTGGRVHVRYINLSGWMLVSL